MLCYLLPVIHICFAPRRKANFVSLTASAPSRLGSGLPSQPTGLRFESLGKPLLLFLWYKEEEGTTEVFFGEGGGEDCVVSRRGGVWIWIMDMGVDVDMDMDTYPYPWSQSTI